MLFRSSGAHSGFAQHAFSASSRLTRIVAAVLVFAMAWMTLIVALTLLSQHARWPVAHLTMLAAA